MKKNSFNFVFVHGWGFDDTFWNKLVEKFENKSFCSEIFKIDLNFFSKKKS